MALALFASALCGREWADSSGGFRVEAKLVSVKNQKAYLEKTSGAVIAVPLTKLSRGDLEYLLTLPEYREYFEKNPLPGLKRSAPATQMATIHVDDESKVGEIRRFPDMGWGVKSLAFSPDGRLLAVGKMDRALMVYDLDKSQRASFLEKLDGLGSVTALAFTHNGQKLLAGGDRGRIQVWNVAPDGTLTEANRFVGHSNEVLTITVSSDGKHVLSGGGEKKIRYWDLDSGRELFAVDGFKGDVKASFLTRSGKQGLGCDGQTLALIDIAQGKVIQEMELTARHSKAAIAPDGSHVATTDGYDLQIWEIRTGKQLSTLKDNESQWSLAFLPNSRYVLSGGRGKTSLWEIATQRKLYEFDTEGSGYVQTIACSPDKRHFSAIPGSAGQTLQVFRLPAGVAED